MHGLSPAEENVWGSVWYRLSRTDQSVGRYDTYRKEKLLLQIQKWPHSSLLYIVKTVKRYFESSIRKSGTVVQNKLSKGWITRWRPCPCPIPERLVLCPPVQWRELPTGSWTCRRRLSVPTAPRPERKWNFFAEKWMDWTHSYWDSSGLRRK